MFCIQENQFVSPAVPGTLEKLNEILDSPRTKWKIETIRAVRKPEAIKLWASNTEFQKFCLKEAAKKKVGEAFQQLTEEEKLEMGYSLKGIATTTYLWSKGLRRDAPEERPQQNDETQGAGWHPPQRSVYVRRGPCGQPA